MSLSRSLFNEFRPLFRMLDEPLGLHHPARAFQFHDQLHPFKPFAALRPSVELHEDVKSGGYVVEAELPGVRRGDLDVRMGADGRTLYIEGSVRPRHGAQAEPVEVKNDASANTDEGASTEGSSDAAGVSSSVSKATPTAAEPAQQQSVQNGSRFQSTVMLPRHVDGSRISAKLLDGLLTVTIPKAEEKGFVKITVE